MVFYTKLVKHMNEGNNARRNTNNSFNYMLFGLGAVLIIVGVYLTTYTTVEMVNRNVSYGGFSVDVPQAQEVQPYQPIGIIVALSASALIGLALYRVYLSGSPAYSGKLVQQERIDNYSENQFISYIRPPISHSSLVNSWWSFPIGAFVTFVVFVMQITLGNTNSSEIILGVALPIFYSVIAGSIVGLIALLLINKINESKTR